VFHLSLIGSAQVHTLLTALALFLLEMKAGDIVGKIIAIANQKGGVGKTTTSVNLGACLAYIGKRVLLVDVDPQGNATSGIGIEKADVEHCIYDILVDDVDVKEVIKQTAVENLDIIPATIQLAGAEIELVPTISREVRLKRALESVKDQYDYMVIDCPPSLGLLTINALTASDAVLIPVQCEYYALEGLSQLLNTVRLVQKHLNTELMIEGVLLTMLDARTNLGIQVIDEVKKYFQDKVYKTIIPRNIRLSEAPSHGQPIIIYDPRSRGAEVYLDLAKEVVVNG
jgi:chromosome partitioning protein